MWKIGDGQSIKITSNKWLPHPPLFKPGANTTLTVGSGDFRNFVQSVPISLLKYFGSFRFISGGKHGLETL